MQHKLTPPTKLINLLRKSFGFRFDIHTNLNREELVQGKCAKNTFNKTRGHHLTLFAMAIPISFTITEGMVSYRVLLATRSCG